MHEIVVLSGKGGTGKTTLAASISSHVDRLVLADADVDAPNLHLLLDSRLVEEKAYYGSRKPVCDFELCTECGLCTSICRFGAIVNGKIDEHRCEGCEFCYHACPEQAIRLEDALSGHIFVSGTRTGPFVHARLGVAQENSGKLVSSLKKSAREIAEEGNYGFLVVDGPPGIGCPVIASISGADLTVIVTEPTTAGLHDLERVLDLAAHFGVPAVVCLNKYDLDPTKAAEVEHFCQEHGVPLVGRIRFAPEVVKAQLEGRLPGEGDAPLRGQFNEVWRNILKRLEA
ncbi:MAG: ATP-binding protein [Eubacteriales bacterium]|nr:ATP-binding protein [Bacillota bacterium]MBV1728210.1 ATP-binding protein [Desulforudis sp.]MDQ7789932.1 ATP-binding protein [Clostridia bacterium]MDZ4043380.1 ATP-binding protein [Eubacteriales bacterium]MBU4532360.1 ATP-binding protein [Bacillota bacterium]